MIWFKWPSTWLACCWLLFCGGSVPAQWAFLGDPLISNGGVSSQSLAFSPDWHPHLAFTSGGKVEVQRYDGNEWVSLGTTGLPIDGINGCALAFSGTEDPLLVLSPTISVYVHDNSGWQSLPLPSTTTMAQGMQFRISNAGALWLSWFEAGTSDTSFVYVLPQGSNWVLAGKLAGRVIDMELDDVGLPLLLLANATTLLHYNGNVWQQMTPFTAPIESYVSFAMSYDGTSTSAMVMRRDSSDGLSVELMSLGNWVQLGTAGFATGDVADFGISHAGTPHVVAVDHVNNAPPRAYQFVAGNWQLLGGQTVYNNTVSQPQLAFDATAAYIAFRDDEESLRNSVMYIGSASGRLDELQAQGSLLWPNPVADELNLEIEGHHGHLRVSILNASGQLVQESDFTGAESIKLDVSRLRNGLYFYRLQTAHRPTIGGSFCKQL